MADAEPMAATAKAVPITIPAFQRPPTRRMVPDYEAWPLGRCARLPRGRLRGTASRGHATRPNASSRE